MLGSPAGPGGPPQRGLWPLVPGSANSAAGYTSDGFGKCGVYSLFPGGPSLGNAFYSHARTIGQFATGHIQQPPTNTFYHKDSIYSTSNYTFGAPTPPPGSPYSPVSLNQFELLSKGFNSHIIAQQPDYLVAPKKLQIQEKHCDEKCCNLKSQKTCHSEPVKKTHEGCSRTNPVDWNGVNVKKEPGGAASISELAAAAPMVKLEITSPKNSALLGVSNTDLNNCVGGLSVGFAVARPKIQPDIIGSPALPPVGLLTTVNAAAASTVSVQAKDSVGESTISTVTDISSVQGTIGGGTVLHCTEDRSTSLAGWTMGGAHSSALNPPTVWQYPAPVPMEPMLPLPVPMPPVGFQLARDPTTGGLLLFPTTEIETLQQAVVWPTYHQHPPVLLPPLPPLPLQLLTSGSSEYVSSNASLHQQTQSHSTRLLTVATDNKRKIPLPIPATTLIKIETDSSNLDQNKAVQAVNAVSNNTTSVFTDQPIVATHVIYQHPQSLILSQPHAPDTICRSQATSPVSCLTPPPEATLVQETLTTSVQDASNQTDAPSAVDCDSSVAKTNSSNNHVPENVKPELNTNTNKAEDINEVEKPDISGLELLSNSIIEFASNEKIQQNDKEALQMNNNLDGLDLLCALAEQRIREENVEKQIPKEKENNKRKLTKQAENCTQKRIKETPEPPLVKDSEKECSCVSTLCKAHGCDDWSMNEMELDMRIKLADLQRQYREKQKELKKLKPKQRHSQDCRKSIEEPERRTPSPVSIRPKENNVFLKPPTLCCFENKEETNLSPKRSSSSKKRKVGRPKKLLSSSGCHVTTETIVAKKHKNNFVGYLLAAKEKLQLQKKLSSKSPPKYQDDHDGHEKYKNNNNVEEIKLKIKVDEMKEKDEGKIDPVAVDLDVKCTLNSEHLEIDKLRVLTAMGGLFYAGILNAVEPPDVYSITLDGERGNKPHIMSREEILRDAILELAPKKPEELTFGTRVCAYWSQQYRCLYPGTVAEPGTPDPVLDSKFVAVEFDDGDSGTISIEDIRLLPSNYPIIEYDPNPLLSLSKRKRRISSSVAKEETKPQPQVFFADSVKQDIDFDLGKENKDVNNQKERKRLKKKKRDKLKQKLCEEVKKKKRKHKCSGEFCKHRKHHKKHHKHRKHHHHSEHKVENQIPTPEVTFELRVDEIDNLESSNPDEEVTLDDIMEVAQQSNNNYKKIRDRQGSCESRSKMSAFLPARQLWGWSGKGYRRPRAKGRSRKQFYKAIQRGKETITVGDAAVFLSTGRPDRPYIGKIEAMWELCGTMAVKVKWFYHPEETVGCPLNLQYPGALFESPHIDENDVQTISHKCEVLPLKEYVERLGNDPRRFASIYDNNDIYYLAGYYDPTTIKLKIESNIPFRDLNDQSNNPCIIEESQ